MLPLLSLASNNSPGSNSSSTFLQIKFVRSRLPGGRTDRWTLRVLSSSDRKSTRLNSSHLVISYAVFCLKKKIPRDGGLRDAELVDAVADRLQPLAARVVPEPAHHALAHHELEPARRLVLVAPAEVLPLGGRGQRVVPALRTRELDDHRRVALARDTLDRDAFALERGLEILGRAVGLAGRSEEHTSEL